VLELAAPWYWGPSEARLGDERQDRAGDEVPVPAESQRDDRLDVEDVLPPLSGPTPKATLSWNGMPIIKTPPQKGLPRPYVVAVIHGA